MPHTAKVAVAAAVYAIDRPFDYLIPSHMAQRVQPGVRVAVPFGRGNRLSDGIVLALGSTEDTTKLKPIQTVLDQEPVLTRENIQLALWMREHYFCTVYEAIRVMLPAGLWYSLKESWSVAPGVDREKLYQLAGEQRDALRLADILCAHGGSAELGEIQSSFGGTDPWPALRLLSQSGGIIRSADGIPEVKDKLEQRASLAIPPEEALAQVSGRKRRAPLQYEAVKVLCEMGEVSAKELCYFTGASLQTLRSLEKQGIVLLHKQEVYRRPSQGQEIQKPLAPVTLNQQQQQAMEGLWTLMEKQKPAAALLYGVTGSGKTQVYIQLIHNSLEQGRGAMVLVPEISLTPQLMGLFTQHFGQQVAILHSALSSGERYDEWKRVRAGEAMVVVGTRSAVFAPVKNLGLIVLDEEQEPTYQSEQNPRYHARDVAKFRCSREGALLLLGSATPSVETMYHALEGPYHFFQISHRFNQRELPQVTVVDMREELRAGHNAVISQPLEQALRETIARGEQAILFVNRRGSSNMVMCGECGASPECPRCSVHLTYHRANGRLMCHHCGYSQPLPHSCPQCGGMFSFQGIGTQKVEEELNRLFPGVGVMRMDTDTVTGVQGHAKLLAQFQKEKIPVLVGTQMVAKGLDFENVTLVGAVSADQTLYVEDYRGGERTFSLLTQVVGRAGRGGKTGRAMIQTFTPDNEVIECAARQDYDTFYAQEIRLRQLRDYPPFGDLFVIHVTGEVEEDVMRVSVRLRRVLEQLLSQQTGAATACRLLGPAPDRVVKVNNRYRYHLTLQTQNTKSMRELVAHVVRQAQKDKANRGVSVYGDINPQD